MRIGRSRSSKAIDFGTNRKGVCDFLLVTNSNFGPVLHRFWDTETYWLEIANSAKTRVLGLSVGEDFVILTCVVLTQCQRVTDRQTDEVRRGTCL